MWWMGYELQQRPSWFYKGQIAIKKDDGYTRSIYGSEIHDDNRSEYEWKLRLKFLDSRKRIETYIGVIQDKKECLMAHLGNYDYDHGYHTNGYGCWLCTDGAFSNNGMETTIVHRIDPSKQDTVQYGMKIDLKSKKIYFSVDDNDYVEAPYTLKGDRYRLVVTLITTNVQVELLWVTKIFPLQNDEEQLFFELRNFGRIILECDQK